MTMTTITLARRLITLGAFTALAACGSSTATPAPAAGSGGSSADAGVSGTGGGSSGGAGGAAGSGGRPGDGGTGGAVNADGAVACMAQTAFTLAIHVVVDLSWPDTIGSNAGTGKMHVWNLARMNANGTALAGMTQPCGSTLPELTFKPLVGGGKSQLDVPDAVWDAPNAPKAASAGMISGWSPGSTLTTDATNVLVGLTMPDPNGAWPATHDMVTAVDSDGDGKPGITSVPKSGSGFVLPPVSTPILGIGPKADKVYLASRTAIALSGTVSSCTEQSGTVTVKFFDNHIVGCHVSGGDECTTAQVDFLDTNSTKFTVMGGTFTSKLVPDTASCADARKM